LPVTYKAGKKSRERETEMEFKTKFQIGKNAFCTIDNKVTFVKTIDVTIYQSSQFNEARIVYAVQKNDDTNYEKVSIKIKEELLFKTKQDLIDSL
jgi:hypothetical protein